jgi:hypothetical protein
LYGLKPVPFKRVLTQTLKLVHTLIAGAFKEKSGNPLVPPSSPSPERIDTDFRELPLRESITSLVKFARDLV